MPEDMRPTSDRLCELVSQRGLESVLDALSEGLVKSAIYHCEDVQWFRKYMTLAISVDVLKTLWDKTFTEF